MARVKQIPYIVLNPKYDVSMINLFNRKHKPKEETHTLWLISENKGSFSSEVMISKHPIFEDKNEAIAYCKQLEQHGIKAGLFPMKFTDEDISEWREKGLTIVEKKDKKQLEAEYNELMELTDNFNVEKIYQDVMHTDLEGYRWTVFSINMIVKDLYEPKCNHCNNNNPEKFGFIVIINKTSNIVDGYFFCNNCLKEDGSANNIIQLDIFQKHRLYKLFKEGTDDKGNILETTLEWYPMNEMAEWLFNIYKANLEDEYKNRNSSRH